MPLPLLGEAMMRTRGGCWGEVWRGEAGEGRGLEG